MPTPEQYNLQNQINGHISKRFIFVVFSYL